MSDERTFPRGGGESAENNAPGNLRKSGHHKKFADDEFTHAKSGDAADHEANLFTQLKKRKTTIDAKKKAANESKRKKVKLEQVIDKDDKIVEHLTYSVLSPGMLLLGRIKEFLGMDISVVLPGGLHGFVSPFDVSDPFTLRLNALQADTKSEEDEVQKLIRMLSPGKLVLCKVKDVEIDPATAKNPTPRTRIHLTINPKDIVPALKNHLFNGLNIPCAIESIEDHGYVLDVGLGNEGVRGFLPLEKAKVDGQSEMDLDVGQVLFSAIESGGLKNAPDAEPVRSLKLTRNLSSVSVSVKKVSPACLLPGAIVDVKVTDVERRGLRVECGSVKGYVSRFHLINPEDTVDNYRVGQSISARVIYFQPVTKLMAFTLKSSLWTLRSCDTVAHPDIYEGLVVDDALVTDAIDNVGIYLRLPNGYRAFCSKKNLHMNSTESVKNVFKVNTKRACVVIGFNDFDEVALVSLSARLINQPVLSYKQLAPGQIVEGKISALVPSGVVVVIGDRIHGFVPSKHLSEVPLTHWEKKFSDGHSITCMVTEVDPVRKTLILSHKKSLMEAKNHLTSYEEAGIDHVCTGVIQKIRDTGMVVRFLQNIRGWVPREEFDEGINLENLYYEGQTVRCRVLRCDKKTANLRLSLKLIKAESSDTQASASDVASIQQCKVTKVTAKGLQVVLVPSEARGFIPVYHLADSALEATEAIGKFPLNQFIPRAVVLKMYPLILSIKPSYIGAANNHDLPTSYREVHIDRRCVATVNNLKNYGVFVDICNDVGGLVPNRLISNEDRQTLQPGDTVIVTVEELHEEQKRLLLRFDSKVGVEKKEELTEESPVETTEESEQLKSRKARAVNDDSPVEGPHAFGDIIYAKVMAVETSWLKLRTPKKMIGYVRPNELSDKPDCKKAQLSSYHVGQVVYARVIGIKPSTIGNKKQRKLIMKKVKPKPPTYDFSLRQSITAISDLEELKKAIRESLPVKREKQVEEIKKEPTETVETVVVTSAPVRAQTHPVRKTASTVGSLLPRLADVGFNWSEEDEEESGQAQNVAKSPQPTSSHSHHGHIGHRSERLTYEKERAGKEKNEEELSSADDFEKLVLSKSNESMAWIRYMAFLMQKGQIEDARKLGQRALKTINFREDAERFNVWIALLNLENLHGTPESLDDCLHNAVQHADALKVYRQMAAIFANTGKEEDALRTYKKMTAKFKNEKDVWLDYGAFLMKAEKLEEARQTMQRSLQVLDSKNQVDVIIRFAILELQYGSRERAKTMFENLVASYPKRTDLFHTYLSQMIKFGESASFVRGLFERVISMKLPAKKIKAFFKRYLEFEEKQGTPQTVKHVQQMAEEYVKASSTVDA